MKQANTTIGKYLFGLSRAKGASVLTIALVSTLLTFTPINPVAADETTPTNITDSTVNPETNNGSADNGNDPVSPLDPNNPIIEPVNPGEHSNLSDTETDKDETLTDGSQSDNELGLSTDASGQPTPVPVDEEDVETPTPFAYVSGGTWNGVTWELRNDKLGGANYELYLGHPDGVTPQTITPTINMMTAPWWTNTTYQANITEINVRGPVKAPISLSRAFESFIRLTAWNDLSPTTGVAFFDTSNVIDMGSMFHSASLANIDGLTDWDTSKVTSMYYMFGQCKFVDVDALADWNISNVTNISQMFRLCSSLADIDALVDWNTSKVAYMTYMFASCASLNNIDAIAGWDVSNVTAMHCMFQDCVGLTSVDISSWDLSKVPNVNANITIPTSPGMQLMFAGCSSLRTLVLGAKSRLWPNYAGVPNAPGNNVLSFVTDGLQTNTQKYMTTWQEIGTGTVDDPAGDIVGTGKQLMTRSQNAATAPGTYVWRPKHEVKLDGNGGNWVAVNPDTGLPATDAFLYVPRPATVGGAGQTVNLTNPNPITSLPTNTSSNFYGWTTTPDLLSTKTTTVGPVDSDITVYALWSKLEIISSPTDFDFGSNPFSTSTRSLNLDAGSPLYTPVDVANGFVLSVGSNALVKWQVSATLDPFVDSVSLGGALPVGVGLDITGMTHVEQTSPPATQLPVFNPNLSLPADGTTSQIIAGSGALPADGGGVWEISIPFNNVKLTVPPVSNAYVGRWKSTLTWSLEDLP